MIRTIAARIPTPDPRPPLAGRDVALAALFTLAGGVLLLFLQEDGSGAGDPARTMPLMGLAFVAVALPVLWRRRAPLHALAATSVALAIHMLLWQHMTRCGVVMPLLWVEVFAAATLLGTRPALAGLAIALAGQTVGMLDDYSAGLGGLTIALPVTVVVWGIGRVARSRAGLAAQLAERNGQLRAARDERARMEVATDRMRVATELDALLRRRLAELTRLADAGAGDDAAGALATIERESRGTLEAMRDAVGVLRGEEPGPTAPLPTLTAVDALLVHHAGPDARLRVLGSPRALPPGLELSAYRIVEHLVESLQDGPAAQVTLDFTGDGLVVTVAGRAARRPDAAIQRAKERVALHHGKLTARLADGRAEVVVDLPVLATA